MNNISVANLYTYPLKSCQGIILDEVKVLSTGFEFDRYFAVINNKNQIITARENPKLLKIETKINDEQLSLSNNSQETINIDLNIYSDKSTEITLFKKNTFGRLINKEADQCLSNILNEPCKLIKIDKEKLRTIKDTDQQISFSDAYPIHLVTTASIRDLNNKLTTPITDNRYRPNIILSGVKEAYEEENWKSITIGNCEFEVIEQTERCSLITINADTLEKSQKQEPLRTLAKNKRDSKKVNFGIYLIPSNKSDIKNRKNKYYS